MSPPGRSKIWPIRCDSFNRRHRWYLLAPRWRFKMARTLHRAEPVHRQRFRYSRYQSGFNHRTWQLHRRWRQQRTWRRFEKRSLEWLAIPTKVGNQNAGCIHVQCDYLHVRRRYVATVRYQGWYVLEELWHTPRNRSPIGTCFVEPGILLQRFVRTAGYLQ